MSTHINAHDLKQFIIDKVGLKLNQNEAKKLDVDKKDYIEANVDENEYLDIDEILDSDDVLAQFTKEYAEQEEELAAEDKDKKEERLNKERTSGKSDAKA